MAGKVSEGEFGTARARYAPPEQGPFQCGNCGHFRWPNRCDHAKVIADAKAGEDGLSESKDGLATVKAGGCCNYFWPKG